MPPIRFSPSSLSVMRDCQRCFWLEQRAKIKRPRGIFPSLPGGMDRILKAYVDSFEPGCLPPECADIKDARAYPDRELIGRWRNWRTAPMVKVGEAVLSGALDDVLQFSDGTVAPWDFKTRGAPPIDGDSEKYYGAQADIYELLLSAGAHLTTRGQSYLTYYWPAQCLENSKVIFNVRTVVIESSGERAMRLAGDALSVLALTTPPKAAPACEYCTYGMALAVQDGQMTLPG